MLMVHDPNALLLVRPVTMDFERRSVEVLENESVECFAILIEVGVV